MVDRVSPTETRPTHHLKLSDGVNSVSLILSDNQGNARENAFERLPIPRSALKTYQGDAEYSDQEMPWSIKQQADWSGGRGSDELDSAVNMFYDSQGANSLRASELVAGGMESFSIGAYMKGQQNWPYRYAGSSTEIEHRWITLTGAQRWMAMKFTTTDAFTAVYVTLIVRRRGTPGTLTVTLRNHNASPAQPGTQVSGSTALRTASDQTESLAVVWKAEVSSGLSGSTAYWVQAEGAATDDASNHWEILAVYYNLGSNPGMQSVDGTTWASSSYDLYHRVTELITGYRPIFFNYKGALFCAFEYPTTGGAKLYINGDQGVASAGAADSLTDATKSWTTDEWKGCILVVRWGTGSGIYTNYRVISGNNGTVLTVDADWEINPDTTSEYVILGSDKWTEVSGHGCNQITDVCVFNNLAYFACGTGQDIRRMRRYNNAGTWTIAYAADTGRAKFILARGSGASAQIWKAEADDSTINYATAVAETGSALTYSADLTVGDVGERITSLALYGEDDNLWVGKEGSVYEIQFDGTSTYTPVRMKLDELALVKDDRNARSMIHHNAYLFFSVHNQVQRYYSGGLDNIGPGYYPQDKLGMVSDLIGYPGMLIAAIDAETMKYGRILAYKGGGWHSLWDGDYNSRCRGMFVQTLPGDHCDRLWFNSGLDLGWIPIDLNPGDRKQTSYHFYPFRWESSLTTGRIYMNMKALTKYWHAVSLVGDLNTTHGQTVEVDYQTDTDTETTWHYLGAFNATVTEVKFTAVTARWIRLRYRLLTWQTNYTPRMKASLVEALIKLQIKWQTVATFRVRDDDQDLQGDPELVSVDTKLNQLETWAGAPTLLTVASTSKRLNGRSVFIEAQSLRPVSETHHDGNETYIWTMSMVEK